MLIILRQRTKHAQFWFEVRFLLKYAIDINLHFFSFTGVRTIVNDCEQYADFNLSERDGWQTVGSRRNTQKTRVNIASQRSPTKSKSAPSPSQRNRKKKSKSGMSQRNVVSGTLQNVAAQNQKSVQRPSQSNTNSPQRKLTPRMKICLDRVLTSNRGSFTFLCDACLCGACPQMIRKHDTANHCNSSRKHPWSSSKVMVYIPESRGKAPVRIRPRSKGLFGKAKMCWHLNNVCWRGDSCTFAHNEIEQQVWDIGVINYEDVVKHCTTKVQPIADTYCCTYCDKSFIGKSAFEDHINTEDHKSNITSDHDRPWKYREPPPNVINGSYTLCQR